MTRMFVVLENKYTSQVEIDGKRYGNGTYVLEYNGVIKFRVNHDLLVITIRDNIKDVHRVYIPIYLVHQLTFVNI